MNTTAKRGELIAAVVLATLTLLAVASAAGAQSWGHMYDWARLNHEPHWRAILFPISVDGAIVASTIVLYIDHRLNRPGHKLAQWLLGLGVAISVVANVLHESNGWVAAKSISAVGPLALFGIFHLFTQLISSLSGMIPEKEPKRAKVTEQETEKVADAPGALASTTAPAIIAAPLPAPQPIRIGVRGAVRRSRGPVRLAGRGRGRNAPQAPATAAPADVLATAPPPPPPAEPPIHPVDVPDAPDVAALNGKERSTRTARIRKPKKAATGALTPQQEEDAFRFWESERQAGRTPSAADIGRAINASRSSGHRLQQKFKEAAA